jgi:class 3 adenylate cyclase/tetratricopeptide (TPR) repeat protein
LGPVHTLSNVFCVRCGAALAADARFCARCGAPVQAPDEPVEHRKLVTILFADIAGSTAMGEALDPEAVRTLLSRHFAAIRTVLERHGGTVEKFIGDAVMAVFGIPEAHEDDALRAVRAALELQASIARLNAEPGAVSMLAVRVGVNTGEVVTGEGRSGETLATGDTVNTAARLEQAAPVGSILIGEATYRLVTDAVVAEPVPPLAAKGKAQPVPAYELVSLVGEEGRRRQLEARLVGRGEEMGALRRAWAEVQGGDGARLVTVVAPAGVGKSRLIRELEREVMEDARVLVSRCLPYGDGITYWPIRGLVLDAAAVEETDAVEVARDKVRRLLEGQADADFVADKVSGAIGLSEVATSQDELFWAVRRTLEAIAEHPTLLVIEDLHWAEPTLLDLVPYVADLATAPMLLLATARPELLESRPEWGSLGGRATLLRLEPLGAEDTGALLEGQAGGAALPDGLRRRILDAAEGNPLFIEEMVAMLREGGGLVQDGEAWRAADGVRDVEVPTSIRALLSARLDRLPSDERVITERAAVVGRTFEASAVAELAPGPLRNGLGRHLLALVRKELLRPDRADLTPGDAFRFRHVLIRDAAYEMLPKRQRAELHERFAGWLERVAGDRLIEFEEILGYHLEQAAGYWREVGQETDADRLAQAAGEHLLAAGLRAARRGDNAAAIPLLTKAAEYVTGPERTEALLELSPIIRGSGEFTRSQAILEQVEREARQRGDRVTELRARIRHLGDVMGGPGVNKGSIEAELRAIIVELGPAGPLPDLATAWLAIGMLQPGGGDAEREAFERAIELGLEGGDQRIPSAAIANLSSALKAGPMPVNEALRELDAYEKRPIGARRAGAALKTARAGLLAMIGDFDTGRALMADAIEICHELRIYDWEAYIRGEAAALELLAGDPEAAAAVLEPNEELIQDMGPQRRSFMGDQAPVLEALGRHEEAFLTADETLDGIDAPLELAVKVLPAKAKAQHALDDLTGARSTIDEVIRVVSDLSFLADLGDALLERATIRRDVGDASWTDDLKLARDAYARKGHLVGLSRVDALASAATTSPG